MAEDLTSHNASSAYVVIVGCGRFGAYLADRLSAGGHSVLAIDRDESAFTSLAPEFGGDRLTGDFLKHTTLERAKIVEADIVLVVTSKDDFNLAAGLVCRKALGVDAVAVRVRDIARAASYGDLSIETVCPPALGVSAFLHRVEQSLEPGGCTRSETPPHRQGEETEPMDDSLFIVVVGCGRLGSHLASQLSRSGHRVVIIDREESSFAALSAETFSGFRVEGDASEPAVLRRAKIDQAHVVIAATREDNLNLMVALVAKRVFGVKNVMARVYDPKRQAIYSELGLDTVCPTTLATDAFFRIVERTLQARKGTAR